MDIFSVFTMLGGLAMFLYGMSIMGDGLEKSAGNRLKGILETASKTPVRGLLLGAVVTAVIQSSSATTVMVVGFVNSGLMRLSQAIGIIMGANIGTTATSWILSLTGLQGDTFFIKMLKPSSFFLLPDSGCRWYHHVYVHQEREEKGSGYHLPGLCDPDVRDGDYVRCGSSSEGYSGIPAAVH